MSHGYVAVQWNRQKRRYDVGILLGILLFLTVFSILGRWLRPAVTAETLMIRSTAACALLMLHLILAIGPLCRLDARWLPLLYNRRHLGISFFGVATFHAGMSLVQFHAFGDQSPLLSLLTSNGRFESLSQFPFQLLGLAVWLVFLSMAVTSHDFWLANLTAPFWKALHMGVYLAYGLVVAHVALGAGQSQGEGVLLLLAMGALALGSLHVRAAWRERRLDEVSRDEWVVVPRAKDLADGSARIVQGGGERIAVYRHGDAYHALSNVCQHQNGPLGEGRIVNGCVTCPWHGFQYDAATGAAPAPFQERVPTFDTRWEGDDLWVRTIPRAVSAGAVG